MSNKRSRLFAASTSLMGVGKSGKDYRWAGLPNFGSVDQKKLRTPNSKLQRSSKSQVPKAEASVAEVKAKRPGWMARCVAKVKLLFGRESSSPAIPRFERAPVQGELSLDNVKVKCNDLSDTDFEFVAKPAAPKKPATAAPAEAAPAISAGPAPETGTRIWNRVTTLLGAGQS